jgi:hypothetical protein
LYGSDLLGEHTMTMECAAGLFEWSMQHQDGSNSNGGNVKELDPAKKEWCV